MENTEESTGKNLLPDNQFLQCIACKLELQSLETMKNHVARDCPKSLIHFDNLQNQDENFKTPAKLNKQSLMSQRLKQGRFPPLGFFPLGTRSPNKGVILKDHSQKRPIYHENQGNKRQNQQKNIPQLGSKNSESQKRVSNSSNLDVNSQCHNPSTSNLNYNIQNHQKESNANLLKEQISKSLDEQKKETGNLQPFICYVKPTSSCTFQTTSVKDYAQHVIDFHPDVLRN